MSLRCYRRSIASVALFFLFTSLWAAPEPKEPTTTKLEEPRRFNRRVLMLDFVNQRRSKDDGYLEKSIPDAFESSLQKTKSFEILSRATGERLIVSLGIQSQDLYSEENAIKIGKASGADVVVIGNFLVTGEKKKQLRMQSKAIDIMSSRIADIDNEEVVMDSSLFTGISILADRMAANLKQKLPPLLEPSPTASVGIEPLPGEKPVHTRSFWRKPLDARIGIGLPALMRVADSNVNKYYGSGLGILAEMHYWGITIGGHYKGFSFSDKQDLPQTAKLTMFGFDLGYKYTLPWKWEFNFGKLEAYVGAAGTYVFATETAADGSSYNFRSLGAYGKLGAQLAFYKSLSSYLEFRYGYTPVGVNKANTEGVQVLIGLSMRLLEG